MQTLQHPVRIDASTQAIFQPSSALVKNSCAPTGSFFLNFSPAVFLHAYVLPGESPQRFGSDLSLYLATVNAFFAKSPTVQTGFVSLVGITQTDTKKRLSEDLGVALSSLFMAEAFGVTWDTIAQIPQNSKLSKKRPDFECFDTAGNRHLFEAKGTTVLAGVDVALTKAIAQVKKYPEASNTKLAIVSFLSTDDRLFPSQTFVVDPPTLPDNIPPTKRVAQLLHGEKILQFAGLSQTGAAYMKALSVKLRAESAGNGQIAPIEKGPALSTKLNQEIEQSALQVRQIGNTSYVGRNIFDGLGVRIFVGATRRQLDALALLTDLPTGETYSRPQGDDFHSFFADGTCLLIERS